MKPYVPYNVARCCRIRNAICDPGKKKFSMSDCYEKCAVNSFQRVTSLREIIDHKLAVPV